jgi:hypothetical protein
MPHASCFFRRAALGVVFLIDARIMDEHVWGTTVTVSEHGTPERGNAGSVTEIKRDQLMGCFVCLWGAMKRLEDLSGFMVRTVVVQHDTDTTSGQLAGNFGSDAS